MKVLLFGGAGKISSACTTLAVQRGHEKYLMHRGQTDAPAPDGTSDRAAR